MVLIWWLCKVIRTVYGKRVYIICTGALRRGAGSDLGRGDRHGHVRRGRNSSRHNERETQKSMNDLDDDDNFSMRFQTLDEVVGQVLSFIRKTTS